MFKRIIISVLCLFFIQFSSFTQTHNALPIEDPIYYLIETAQMRGLINILPHAKPYSRAQVIEIIDEILNNPMEEGRGILSERERKIITGHRERLETERGGLDLVRGTITGEHEFKHIYLSFEFGFGMDFTYAGSYFSRASGYQYRPGDAPAFKDANHPDKGDFYSAIDVGVPFLSFTGDLGKKHSYGLTLQGRIAKNPRSILGRGHNDYFDYNDSFPDGAYSDRERQIRILSEPHAYFPYSYKKRWDSFLWNTDDVASNSMVAWPDKVAIGYRMIPELSGAFLNGIVNYRIARVDREWTGMAAGSSLNLNYAAQPFLAAEVTISPFYWLSISSITGILEYNNAIGWSDGDAGQQSVALAQQNAFSMVMLELNIKNYFHIDVGTNVVWPKRFEFGYLFPFAENLLSQNLMGDFDNVGLFLNLKGQYPGLGMAWISFFLDEVNISEPNLFEKDRTMFAFQFGGQYHFKWLPFTSITFSYTKVEPYNYTHLRVDESPWYNGILMETNYVNSGKSLGYYLPPNSDEMLLRIETMPINQARFSFQYQLIRHGADYGNRAVDGSSLWSELESRGRAGYYKYFLRDGAYQWMHIFRLRGEYSFVEKRWPVRIFAEIGGVYSYFTDIDSSIPPNSNYASPFKKINTPQYPVQMRFIGIIGFTIFPK